MSASTSPDMSGPLTLGISSFVGLSNSAAMEWRAGSTQPDISLQVMADGAPVNLAGATATINFWVPTVKGYCQSSVMTLGSDNETLKYERLLTDYTTINPGHYYFSITAIYPDGTGFTAPDNGEALLIVQPQF